ncbi:MAG: penicillin acylase family protein, partial [Sneathiella sp.]|nr:penicillin acylase family protein [Sneathiella sp.]
MRHLKYGLMACAAFIGLTSFSPHTFADVRIDRDEYGVPKITADRDDKMWFAFGLAQSRDRLIQLETMRQEAYGILPAVDSAEGEQAAKRNTRNWRRLHLFKGLKVKLGAELAGLGDDGASTRTALDCFAAGIQAFKDVIYPGYVLTEVCNLSPDEIKSLVASQTRDLGEREKSFIRDIFRKQKLPTASEDAHRWKAVDSLALFHLRVMHEFSLRNTEMKNLKLLNDLYLVHPPQAADAFPGTRAGKMFNSLKWSLHRNAKTTIPVADGQRDAAHEKALEYHARLIQRIIPAIVDGAPLELNGCKIYNP